MLKIGDFSRLSRVTVKALRFYDERGLLKPSRVDPFTGYRYYTLDQLPQLNRILALKDLGFSLEQIATLAKTALSAQQLKEMLRGKQAEICQRIQDEQTLLERVEARLCQIEQEEAMSGYDVTIKQVAPQWVASVRAVVPTYPDVGTLIGELMGYLGRLPVQPQSGPFILYHDGEYRERDVDAEALIPVPAETPGSERVRVYELPGAETMASLVHHGSYSRLGEAYKAILSWIETNGYRIVGPEREIYLHCGAGPVRQDDESYVTEIQYPVQKA